MNAVGMAGVIEHLHPVYDHLSTHTKPSTESAVATYLWLILLMEVVVTRQTVSFQKS